MSKIIDPKLLASREVFNERENFRNLFKQTPEMVCIMSGPEHVFEFVNEAHIKALGFDATGMPVRVAQPESIEVHGILDSVYQTGKTAHLNEIAVTLGDKTRYFNLTYAARHDLSGSISGVMILGVEVSEQVAVRKALSAAKNDAEKASSMKTAFLANMSHEIRTPLGAILGFADLLKDPSLSEAERSNFLDIITRNGHQLAHTINDILDLTKVETGHMSIDSRAVNIYELVDEVISLLSISASEKNIYLKSSISSSLPKVVFSDPFRIRQILVNIVGNAVKFTQSGGVSVKAVIVDEDFIGFEIKDTGIGIASGQIEKLFQVFTQADESITKKFGGTGLGLALSRKLAQAMGGNLVLSETKEGEGSSFLVTVKNRIHEAPSATSANALFESKKVAKVEIDEKSLNDLRVLLVDDSEDNQQMISLMLSRFGVNVEIAGNGQEALNEVAKKDYDVILMDIQMPVMDGYTATQKLRANGFDRPIIALTAHALNDYRKKCLYVGCTDYLPKPLNMKDLVGMIGQYTVQRLS